MINMARKPKRNQEAYTRLDFLPKQKKLNTETHRVSVFSYPSTCHAKFEPLLVYILLLSL